jgi:hypothetical protein
MMLIKLPRYHKCIKDIRGQHNILWKEQEVSYRIIDVRYVKNPAGSILRKLHAFLRQSEGMELCFAYTRYAYEMDPRGEDKKD